MSSIFTMIINGDLHSHHLQQRQHGGHIFEVRHIADHDLLSCKQRPSQNGQCRVLGARNPNATRQLCSSFD